MRRGILSPDGVSQTVTSAEDCPFGPTTIPVAICFSPCGDMIFVTVSDWAA